MNNIAIALDGAWRVLIAGLLLGAGIPVLFSLAVTNFGMAKGGDALATGGAPKPFGKIVGIALLAVILLIFAYGLSWLIFTSLGFKVGFNGIIPTFTK